MGLHIMSYRASMIGGVLDVARSRRARNAGDLHVSEVRAR